VNLTIHDSPVRPPGFWWNARGGDLKAAVEAYLNRRTLTLRQIALVRAYLCLWISARVWDMDPTADAESRARLRDLRASAERIVTVANIDEWLALAMDEGIDPL
jgi:hypothetical protein